MAAGDGPGRRDAMEAPKKLTLVLPRHCCTTVMLLGHASLLTAANACCTGTAHGSPGGKLSAAIE